MCIRVCAVCVHACIRRCALCGTCVRARECTSVWVVCVYYTAEMWGWTVCLGTSSRWSHALWEFHLQPKQKEADFFHPHSTLCDPAPGGVSGPRMLISCLCDAPSTRTPNQGRPLVQLFWMWTAGPAAVSDAHGATKLWDVGSDRRTSVLPAAWSWRHGDRDTALGGLFHLLHTAIGPWILSTHTLMPFPVAGKINSKQFSMGSHPPHSSRPFFHTYLPHIISISPEHRALSLSFPRQEKVLCLGRALLVLPYNLEGRFSPPLTDLPLCQLTAHAPTVGSAVSGVRHSSGCFWDVNAAGPTPGVSYTAQSNM